MPDSAPARNVIGTVLQSCSTDPMTGFYRDGSCHTGPEDRGTHTVCAVMTEAFLSFTRSRGNDLSTPRPEYDFPGLQAGDRWCLCASRWKEAADADVAPPVVLEATHEKTLETVAKDRLLEHAVTSSG
ncbi:DUF2237 family protein [Longibacter sp.]|jgi:uncharacterized protein (DUF2237 family)|uniref:DUF2237 family protein n=1 Tax=Longibacter sp. TaxID=2045415 RepID=UPI003EC0FBC2